MEIIFDGDCSICQASIRWIERHDPAHHIAAVASDSLEAHEAAVLPIATTVIVRTQDGQVLVKSAAVATVLAELPGWPRIVGRAGLLLVGWAPTRVVTDASYDLVASNRRAISRFLVRIGALEDSCRVPDASR